MKGNLRGLALAWFFAGLPACAPRLGPGDLHTMPVTSIAGDERWQGTVTVDRIVVVRNTGHLMIAPGTKVLFRRVDWDRDGIGDAEITVEGRLTAEGTPDAPILFASAEAAPRPSDWKYLLVNFAAGASLANARVSDAYSGLQVHYSPAVVRRCEFTGNVDGVRFSTARLRVEECWIHGNTNGVRFEERGHPGEVVGCEISDNEVGIFAVAECRGKTTFRGNNLRRNRYAVKLGWEQRVDLAFPGNHWGGTSEAGALETVLDRRTDSTLGTVSIAPALPSAAPLPVPPFVSPNDPAWRKP